MTSASGSISEKRLLRKATSGTTYMDPTAMDSITIAYRYTETEAVRAAMAVTRSALPFIAYMPWLGGSLLSLVLVLFVWEERMGFYAYPLLFFGLLFVCVPALIVFSAKRNFRKNPEAGAVVRWTVRKQALQNETDGSRITFAWDKIWKVEEARSGFLLFLEPQAAHWVPKSGFTDDAGMSAFRGFVTSHGIPLKGGK